MSQFFGSNPSDPQLAGTPLIDIRHDQTKAGPSLTPADIEAEIAGEHYFTAMEGVIGGEMRAGQRIVEIPNQVALGLLTFCVMVLRNGTKIVGINYGPVSPENFNAEQGRTEARANAVEQVWPLLGYALRDKLASQPVAPEPPPDCQHAAPYRYCMQCVADPCPSGLGKQ